MKAIAFSGSTRPGFWSINSIARFSYASSVETTRFIPLTEFQRVGMVASYSYSDTVKPGSDVRKDVMEV